MFKKAFLLSFLLLIPSYSQAARVGRVSIKGNKIIETSLIRSHIRLKKGSIYSPQKVRRDVRKLFSLGFFDDIQVSKTSTGKRVHVSYQVKERVHIGEVEFQGNETLKTKDLEDLSLIKEYNFLDFNKLQETLSLIREKYKEKGYYFAEISHQTLKIPGKKELKLRIEIQENPKLYIKRIHFIGNRNVSSQTLKNFMMNKEKSLLSIFTASGIFQPEHIDRDLQIIEYYYRNQGYLNVRVQSPEISISPDKKFLYMAFPIFEGPRFRVGQVAFQGDEVVPKESLEGKFQLKEDHYFSLGDLQLDMQRISLLYQDKGYAFVKVLPQFFPDNSSNDKIHILLRVEKGKAYKLRRTYIQGNTQVRDKVIFRRSRLQEGELYSESKRRLSEQLLQQMAYLENVELKPVPVGNKEDELDVVINVKEREGIREIQAAAGYNGHTKWFIRGGVKIPNFLGLDQNLSLNGTFDKYQELASLSYQSFYFMDSSWNFSFDIFNVGQDSIRGTNSLFSSQQPHDYLSYSELNTGFAISLGRYMTEFSTLSLKYRFQKQQIAEEPAYFLRNLPGVSKAFDFLFGERDTGTSRRFQSVVFSDIFDLEKANGFNSSLSAILEYDKRNDRYYPTKGFFTRLSAEYSGLGGDFNYSKFYGKFRHYYSPFWKLVLKNRLEYGFVSKNGEEEPLFTELFLIGGPYNLRGFRYNTQGPRKYSEQAYNYAVERELENPEHFARRPYGGAQMVFYSLELEAPIIEQAGLKAAVFLDVGEVGDRLLFDLEDQLRANVGFGIRWRSPFGPIRLDWALPYKPRYDLGEQDWEFQFSMGSEI